MAEFEICTENIDADADLHLLSTDIIPVRSGKHHHSDVVMDGLINVDDILAMIGSWGTPKNDINGDGVTTVDDLLILLENWGPCPDRRFD